MCIEICDKCKGTGLIKDYVGEPDKDYDYITCNNCSGTGKVKTISYKLSVPYDYDVHKLNEAHSKILDVLINLKKK